MRGVRSSRRTVLLHICRGHLIDLAHAGTQGMADLKKSPSLKAQAKHSPQRPLPQSKRRKRSVSTFLQGDVTLTDKAYAQIEELIVTLQLPPGTVLSALVL